MWGKSLGFEKIGFTHCGTGFRFFVGFLVTCNKGARIPVWEDSFED